MDATTETIALLRSGSGLSFTRSVERVFKTSDTAHRWLNRQYQNHDVRRLPGKWKTGDVVPMDLRTQPL